MLEKRLEIELFKKTKNLLKRELLGIKSATKKLSELESLADKHNSNFYQAALNEIKYSSELNQVKLYEISLYTEQELKKLAKEIFKISNSFSSLTKEDIYRYFINLDNDVSLCRVEGDSMTGANILDGDFVIYQKTKFVNNNDIIICSINDRMFIKRFLIIDGRIILRSENSNYLDYPINLDDNFKIIGKVQQLLRNLK